MSRSNKEENYVTNPSTRWFEWSGKEGKLKWYDKDTKQNHFVEDGFKFLVLDQLNTVTGFSDDLQVGYFANEVRRASDILTVRTKKGIYKTGKWKDDLSAIPGARFTKSVYIGYYDNGELKLGNIKFSGSALGGLSEAGMKKNSDMTDAQLNQVGWFNFCKTSPDIEEIAVELSGIVPDKKGSNEFWRPVFKRIEKVSDATNEQALNLDRTLQTYLKAYFAQQPQEEKAMAAGESLSGQEYIDARDREINREYPAEELPEFSGDGSVDEEIEIPF
jgi:hypothetical protein